MGVLSTENLGYYELKQHKPWFDEERSKLLDQWKQAEVQLLQNPSQTNGDNLNIVRQPRTNFIEDENGDILADSHNILNSWKNYLSFIECTWY